MNKSPSPPDAWVAFGESAKYEDCLIGNRKGLEVLRAKIDEALQTGATTLSGDITTATRLLVVDEPANPERIPDKHSRLKNAVGLTGCAVLLVAIVAIFAVGVGTIRGWWK